MDCGGRGFEDGAGCFAEGGRRPGCGGGGEELGERGEGEEGFELGEGLEAREELELGEGYGDLGLVVGIAEIFGVFRVEFSCELFLGMELEREGFVD